MRKIIACYRLLFWIACLVAFFALVDVWAHVALDRVTEKQTQLAMIAGDGASDLSPEQIDVLLRPLDMRQWTARLSALAAAQEVKNLSYHLTPAKSNAPGLARYELSLVFDAPSDVYAYHFFSGLTSLATGRLAFDVLDMERTPTADGRPTELHVRTVLNWLTNAPQQLSQGNRP